MQIIDSKYNELKKNRDMTNNIIDKTLIKISPVTEIDPFQSAHNENMRLDAISSEKQLKLKKFENDLKKRLKAYKKF